MGFHLRKTKKVGLFNFNLSNSGIGTSFGIKGLRTGVDSKGRTYIRGGKGFLRYNKYFGAGNNYNDNITNSDYNYKIRLTNAFISSNVLGAFITFLKFNMCLSLSIFLLSGLTVLATKNSLNIIFFIMFLISIRLIWDFLYYPRFVVQARIAKFYYNYVGYEKALNEFNKAVDLLGNSKIYDCTPEFARWLCNNIFSCYKKLKKYNDAYEFLKKYHNIDNYRENFIGLLGILNKNEELVEFIQQNYTQEEKKEHPKIYTLIAEVFLKLDKPDLALEAMLQGPISARKMDDEMCAFRYTLGLCYEKIGDIENSKKQYNKVYSYNTNYENIKEKINLN